MVRLCFTCTNRCDHSTAIVFRMIWLFTNHNVAVIIAMNGRGEDMVTGLVHVYQQ